MHIDDFSRPLTAEEIEIRKNSFLEFSGKPLTDCTCHDCPAQAANNCTFQWDAYNTSGDCLAEK